MSKAVYVIVSAIAVTAVTFAVYWLKKGVPDTSSLLPYFNRLYEMESHCPQYDLLLKKMGVDDQKKREEMASAKDVFMITRDCHYQLWWHNMIPSNKDDWSIDLVHPTTWVTSDKRSVSSVYKLKGNTLTEVQTWTRKDGKKAKLTITRKFEKGYLTIIRSLDNLRCESKYKFVREYDPYEASKAATPSPANTAAASKSSEGQAVPPQAPSPT